MPAFVAQHRSEHVVDFFLAAGVPSLCAADVEPAPPDATLGTLPAGMHTVRKRVQVSAGNGFEAQRAGAPLERCCGSSGAAVAAEAAPTKGPVRRCAMSLRSRDSDADSASERPGASPSQNGIDGGAPWASSTRTLPCSTFSTRYEVLPSWNTSPARLSTAKSSLIVPTTIDAGSSTTW